MMMMNRKLGCVCYIIMYLCGHEWYYSTVSVSDVCEGGANPNIYFLSHEFVHLAPGFGSNT
jgi:hypothetical protein